MTTINSEQNKQLPEGIGDKKQLKTGSTVGRGELHWVSFPIFKDFQLEDKPWEAQLKLLCTEIHNFTGLKNQRTEFRGSTAAGK